ncbi:MAG: hypothetical protein EOM88_04800 [Clostridia bacterium]|nr:hypothetical protein [Clostridia bacterium]
MNTSLFRPINRRVYLIGLFVILLVNYLLSYLVSKSAGLEDANTGLAIVSLFSGFINIIWDYKRIKDISSNIRFLFLLIIPIFGLVFSTMSFAGEIDTGSVLFFSPDTLDSLTASFFTVMIYPIISSLYRLFLVFMKGQEKTSPDK